MTIWLVAGLALAIFATLSYLAGHNAGYRAGQQHEWRRATALARLPEASEMCDKILGNVHYPVDEALARR